MTITKHEYPIIFFNASYIILFGIVALVRGNYEFLFYVSIVIVLFAILLYKYQKLGLTSGVLWALSLWGLLHMLGGNIPVGDGVLYGVQLIPKILRYDQFVHAFGFGTTTVVGFQLLRPFLTHNFNRFTISLLCIMIGMGAGALNEVIEFMAVLALPETGVGGYYNTAWDLVFNMVGAIGAVLILNKKFMKSL